MKKYLSELLGTFVLVLFGCGTVSLLGEKCSPLVAGLAFGLSYIFGYYALNKVCPCFLNPALSFAAFLDKRIKVKEFLLYILFEFLGAFLAGMQLFIIVMLTSDISALTYNAFAVNGYGDLSKTSISAWGALIVEIILTFFFAFVYLYFSKKSKFAPYFGLILAFSYCLVVFAGYYLTGGSANPARSFGPSFWVVIAGIFESQTQLWVFILGPAIGSFLAFLLYRFAFNKTKSIRRISLSSFLRKKKDKPRHTASKEKNKITDTSKE